LESNKGEMILKAIRVKGVESKKGSKEGSRGM
jgi:hypothetical protein